MTVPVGRRRRWVAPLVAMALVGVGSCSDGSGNGASPPGGSRTLPAAITDARGTTPTTATTPPSAASATTAATATTTIVAPVATGDFSGMPLGRPGCAPASPISASEVPATSSDAEAWGLLFGVPKAGSDLKIVWRMTGSGDLRVTATSPGGAVVAPSWGPEAHGGSNWNRPGDEWGTGWRFDEPGCWRIHLARDNGSADVWLEVPT